MHLRFFSSIAVFAICAHLAYPPQAAFAAASKVVKALSAAAQREFDAGNFDRAGELFLQIYRQEPSELGALYNAARAHHMAGKLAQAAELYAEILAHPQFEAPVKTKVQAFAAEVAKKRGQKAADEAQQAEAANNFSLAAQRWADAVGFQADRRDWQLRRARAEQLAGHADVAVAMYDEWLQAAKADEPQRGDAERWRDELRPAAKVVVAKPDRVPVAPVPVVSKPAEPRPAPVLAYAVLGTGVAALLGGGVVLGLASSADSTLQSQVQHRDSAGHVDAISYTAAAQEASRIEGQYQLGWALAGAGVVAAGVGTWLWLRDGAVPVAVAPTASGLVVAGRW